MSKERMYKERKANIAAFRGCDFNCGYCAFRNTLSRSKPIISDGVKAFVEGEI